VRKELLIILGVTVSVRILLALPALSDNDRVYAVADAVGYERLAVNLLERGVFSQSPGPPYQPELLRTPMYPLFISAVYRVGGAEPRSVVALQIALSALIGLLVYTLSKRAGNRIAFPAALLCGLSPNMGFYAAMLLSEVVFTCILLTGIISLLAGLDTNSLAKISLSGLLIGLSALTRPISLYFPCFVVILVLWIWRKNLRRGLLLVSVFSGVYLATLSPWLARNVRVSDRLIVTTAGELNLFHYHAAMVKAVREGTDVDEARRRLGLEAIKRAENMEIDPLLEAQISSVWAKVAREQLAESPFTYLKLHGLGFASSHLLPLPMNPLIAYFAPSGETPALRRSVMQDVLSFLSAGKLPEAVKLVWRERIEQVPRGTLLVYIAAVVFHLGLLVGVFLFFFCPTSPSARLRHAPILLLSILYFTLVPGPLSGPRFRAPVEPLVAIVAVFGYQKKLKKGQSYKPSSVSRRDRDGDH
jgi:4-amino-4-deoxy-L-arabinose transferase-like glycosyltransferase